MRLRRYFQRNFQNSCKACVGLQRFAILAMPRCKIAAPFRSQNAENAKEMNGKVVVFMYVPGCFAERCHRPNSMSGR